MSLLVRMMSRMLKKLDKETWRRHDNYDAMSTILWINANPKKVLLYQEPAIDPFVPFSLIIQRDFQLEWSLKHGNGGCIVVDGTTNT
jgi:hypothetical protein